MVSILIWIIWGFLAELLAKMIAASDLQIKNKHTHLQGWLLHYGVGIFFAFAYQQFFTGTRPLNKVKEGVIIGALTGVFGMLVWRLTFLLHPNPPRTNYRRFYGQLIVAHIIFGVVARLFLPRMGVAARHPRIQKKQA